MGSEILPIFRTWALIFLALKGEKVKNKMIRSRVLTLRLPTSRTRFVLRSVLASYSLRTRFARMVNTVETVFIYIGVVTVVVLAVAVFLLFCVLVLSCLKKIFGGSGSIKDDGCGKFLGGVCEDLGDAV